MITLTEAVYVADADSDPAGRLDTGRRVGIAEYWPTKWGQPSYNPATGKWEIDNNSREHPQAEWEEIYNGILEHPLDATYRAALSDWIEERFYSEHVLNLISQLRGFRILSEAKELRNCYRERWSGGPGWVIRSEFGTCDTWVGASGQFMQACRGGLFLECPVSNVIFYDLEPLPVPPLIDGSHIGEAMWAIDALQFNGWWHGGGSPGPAAPLERMFVNETIAAFLPEEVCQGGRDIGAYLAYNRRQALFALSAACVNLGRVAVGMPRLEVKTPVALSDWYTNFSAYSEFNDLELSKQGVAYGEEIPGPTPVFGRQYIRRNLL